MTTAELQGMSVADMRKAAIAAGMFRRGFAGVKRESLAAVLAGEMTEAEAYAAAGMPLVAASGGDLAAMIAAAVAPLVAPPVAQLDESRVVELIREHGTGVRQIVVSTGGGAQAVNVGVQHYLFPVLLAAASARVGLYMVGPAGSGKSRAAHSAADALGLAYGDMSVGPQTSKSDIMGFVDAGGTYRPSGFRRIYEGGGVFLFDEIDAASAGVITIINGATANGRCAFPDGMVARHPDCVIMAAANTFGTGADRQYVGRNAFLEWGYDDALEAHMAGVRPAKAQPVIEITPRELSAGERDGWLNRVQDVRANVARCGMRHVVSPRATVYGLALLAAGIDSARVVDMVIAKGLSADDRRKAGI